MRRPLLAAALASAFFAFAAPAEALQCVPFARIESGIAIRGDAWTWWSEAAGVYERGHAPRVGSVLVFQRHGTMRLGHVSVVTKVVNSREVLVDHANWGSGRGDRGRVNTHVGVRDISPNNDWTEVRVWNTGIHDFGTGIYPTYGFIYANHPNRRLEVEEAVFHTNGSHGKTAHKGHGVVKVSLGSAHKPGHVTVLRGGQHKVAVHVPAHDTKAAAHAGKSTAHQQAAVTAAPAHHAAPAKTAKTSAHHQAKSAKPAAHGHKTTKPPAIEQHHNQAPMIETASLKKVAPSAGAMAPGVRDLGVKLDLPSGTYTGYGDLARFDIRPAHTASTGKF